MVNTKGMTTHNTVPIASAQGAEKIYNIGTITNFVATEQEQITNQKSKILYESNYDFSGQELLEINGEPKINGCYSLNSVYKLKSVFENCERFIEVEAKFGKITIKGKTSMKNWYSKSYMQNAIDAGSLNLTASFKIIGRKGQAYIVQFLEIKTC